MKTIFSIIIMAFSLTAMSQNQYSGAWKQVDSLAAVGQSKSALEIVTSVYNKAKAANQPDQFIKASLYRMKLESEFEEDYFVKCIERTRLDIESAKAPVKQILHSILAELYWDYYQANRWKILGRSETANSAGDDIKTWDLKKLVSACMENYTQSLTEKELLKVTAISLYNEILEKQEGSEKFRPTLFDFLAHRAIDFYSSTEAGLTKPAVTFLMDKAEYFSSPVTFAALNIASPDPFSFEFQALKLYQEIIGFHLSDKNPEALIDAELERLSFVHENSVLPEKDSLFLAVLYELEKQFIGYPASTEISYQIALQLEGDVDEMVPYGEQPLNPIPENRKWDKKKAVETCEATIKRFPESFGAANCRALIERIKQPSLALVANYASVPGKPALALVKYKNTTKIFLRLLKMDAETDRELIQLSQDERLARYKAIKPIKSWEQALPDPGDYRGHSAEIRLPATATGYYVLLASNDAAFPAASALVTSVNFWKTNISFLSRNNQGNTEVVVLHRETGQPLQGVKVQVVTRDYDPGQRKYTNTAGKTFVTGKTGMVTIPAKSTGKRYSSYNLVFTAKGDKLIPESYFMSYRNEPEMPRTIIQTHFFTDRAIYRPGQIIYFKGITLERTGEDVKIKPGYKTEVSLLDVNGQLIAKQPLTTNDFGSFSGSFTAPQGTLTGQMTIECRDGSVSVRVEEYKRPKFEVNFEPVKGSYKLGETITAKGKATAYAGSTVSDAKVSYRVVRQASFPYWWWGWRGMPASDEMEITNGETITGSDGTFTINFKAIPDLSVDRKTNPVFTYTVYADVADINGETHSSETGISAGYKALLVNTDLTGDVNLEKGFKFSLSATNLNGEKQQATGSISISKLRVPGQVYFSRKWQRPDQFTMTKAEFEKDFPGEVYNDEDDISTWPLEKAVYSAGFDTKSDSVFAPAQAMAPGMYLLEVKTKDAFGEEILYRKYFSAFQPAATTTGAVSPLFFSLLTPKAEPGENVQFVIGTPVKKAYIIYEVIHDNKIVSRETMNLGQAQKLISIPVKEEYRGNFSINLSLVANNRSFLLSRTITVPHTDKKLDISFATFRNKLMPGQEEEWLVTIRDSKGEKAAAEMLAGMYDASLDAFVPHSWYLNIFGADNNTLPWNDNQNFGNAIADLFYYPELTNYPEARQYDALNWFGFNLLSIRPLAYMMKSEVMEDKAVMAKGDGLPEVVAENVAVSNELNARTAGVQVVNQEKEPVEKPGTSKPVQVRKDFNETAFFYPQLLTNEKGETVIKFRAPEALTRWKMMGLAYTKDLKYGQVEKTLVTQKDLMLFTNAPRFLREGDKMDFSAKISNISESEISGTAELHFFDAFTMKPVDDLLGLTQTNIPFNVNKGLSSALSWNISIPEGLQAVVYRITATAGTFSDGEEAAIPVLTNRMLVTESLPLPVNGMQQKKFKFEKLLNSGKSGSTLRNYRLTLEYTSNPAWYAVQALPYLMEYPYECAEQLFSRYYANTLATNIANSDPKIKNVFESWKTITPDALKSNLEKNDELKSVLVQESPWVREATSESERKQRIALLFDLNRMASEQASALNKLREMQSENGGWPWFNGMPESRYITQHIVTGLGHLAHLNVIMFAENSEAAEMLKKAIGFLDQEVKTDFEKTKKNDKEYLKNNHLGYDEIQYLYARTYFVKDFPVSKDLDEAVGYYKSQSVTYWKTQNNYMKAMMALYLDRFGDKNTASLIMRSLKETSLHNDEMGMYWRNEQRGWNWYQAPIETQALLIEAFDEVSNDQKSVDGLKTWLLKQKQTQDWKTTKATSEAVYALLLRGSSLLASDKQVEILLGNEKVDPYKMDGSKPEAGTGYFKTSWSASAIKPEMGKVTVTNPNPTVAWGALYWQYFEQLDKITPTQTPLSISKKLFREVNTPTGPVIEPIDEKTAVKVGDKIVVRVELRADRAMEYIHLKDMRASAFEPVNVLSGYRWQGGLGYYESTRDASTNFFIYYLPKGTFVFEYKLTATQKGDFSNGITSVQCMYAPEFSAHSEGVRVKVE